MSFRLGLVGLCSSHPECWVPIIRELKTEGIADVEVVAVWDSGATRPAGFAREFAKTFSIAQTPETLAEMVPLVDGVIIHSADWDQHLTQAKPFLDADKAILLDKPIAGNLADINEILDLLKCKKRITGGSSLRFCNEIRDFLALDEKERGVIQSVYSVIGVDDFNYGIHGYTILTGLLGKGMQCVRYLGESNQKQFYMEHQSGASVHFTCGKTAWLPFNLTITTDKKVFQLLIDHTKIYRALLENVLPYLSGKTEVNPISDGEFVEPELIALAAKEAWQSGRTIQLTDLDGAASSYDGAQFAREYRRARLVDYKS